MIVHGILFDQCSDFYREGSSGISHRTRVNSFGHRITRGNFQHKLHILHFTHILRLLSKFFNKLYQYVEIIHDSEIDCISNFFSYETLQNKTNELI